MALAEGCPWGSDTCNYISVDFLLMRYEKRPRQQILAESRRVRGLSDALSQCVWAQGRPRIPVWVQRKKHMPGS